MAGLSPRKFLFSKPIRRRKPIERPAEEARVKSSGVKNRVK
jgi:hypothetical protein